MDLTVIETNSFWIVIIMLTNKTMVPEVELIIFFKSRGSANWLKYLVKSVLFKNPVTVEPLLSATTVDRIKVLSILSTLKKYVWIYRYCMNILYNLIFNVYTVQTSVFSDNVTIMTTSHPKGDRLEGFNCTIVYYL